MAVKISGVAPIVVCPATLYLPGENGTFVQHRFTVNFRRMPTSERTAIVKAFTDGALPLRELLDKTVVGWGGMLDENHQPVPYSSAERIAADEAWDGLEQAMAVSFFDNLNLTQREAALKNSVAPSATA